MLTYDRHGARRRVPIRVLDAFRSVERSTHVEGFWRVTALAASLPLALQIFASRVDIWRRLILDQRLGELSLLLLNDILRSRGIGSGSGLVRHFGRFGAKEERSFRAKISKAGSKATRLREIDVATQIDTRDDSSQ